jgi:hypothetical protein
LDRRALVTTVGEAWPVMGNLGELVKLFAAMRPPKVPVARTMAFGDGHWGTMKRYLEVPDAELNNNSKEKAPHTVVTGRRN